jgi:hypothetical protein
MGMNGAAILYYMILLALLGLPSAPDSQPTVPVGWFFRALVPEDYKVGIDHNTAHNGKGSGFIQYTVHPDVVHPQSGPSFLLQAFKTGKYKGHRVRVTAYAKGDKLSDGSFLWVDLEGGDRVQRQSVAMSPVLMKGTTGWSGHECVLDVSSSMTVMAVGVAMAGRGTIWLDDVRIDVVGTDVPVVGIAGKGPGPLNELEMGEPADGPVNLDFEQ